MNSNNGLLCFTNCLLALEDGKLHERDLWINTDTGLIVDAQRTFFSKKQRPARIIDLKGNILSPGLIDVQINGAYGVDFSIFEGDEGKYEEGLKKVAGKIVETGVTSLVPTIVTQERSLYPKLLHLLRPRSYPNSANLLGWHAEGPFLQAAKRGAHDQNLLISSASKGLSTFDEVYALSSEGLDDGVKIITAAPELGGVLESIEGLVKERGITFSIGHSIASSSIAVSAVHRGARLITHLFNAMPQLHHRDPAIIGLLGAGGGIRDKEKSQGIMGFVQAKIARELGKIPPSEALAEMPTPPGTPITSSYMNSLNKEEVTLDESERPYYGIIVDGVHSHPHSVRLAYNAHPHGCILVTDAMSMLDPHLPDGVHDWRDGRQILKDGDRLYIAGTDTLAGSVITLDKCVKNFSSFTGASFGESLLSATLHPAKCLKIDGRKGVLKGGRDADLTIWDKDTEEVISVWVGGKEVWGQTD